MDPRQSWALVHGEPIDELVARGIHIRCAAILQRVLARLADEGIDALVVKGIVLARVLYARPEERPIRDVDLRVRPRDLARAARAIAAMPKAKRLVESRAYRTEVLRVDGVEIDLEVHVGPPFVCATTVDEMLARAERTSDGLGFAHARPELHDHALLLAVNLFKDRLVDPGQVRGEDLARIARRPRFDAATFAARAGEARCRTIAHVVARHLARTRDDERWRAMADAIAPARPAYARAILASAGDDRGASLAWRMRVRAGSDSRLRALGALGVTALRELELVGGRLRAR